MKACIIGAGVTGLSLLLLLTKAGINPADIVMIDPHFKCGDLGVRWGQVQSNTRWSKTIDAINSCLGLNIPTSHTTTKLSQIADLFIDLTASIPVHRIKGMVTAVERGDNWTITYQTDSTNTLSCTTLFACQGSDQKILNHPIPSISLEYALDSRLSQYINPGDKVIVFGTMHSGTLIIQNLHNLSASITAVYRSVPFLWDRDGAYGGIKEEAAHIADKIVSGEIPVRLVKASELTDIDAKWAIYAIGFTPRLIEGLSETYDGVTGILAPNAWGFGISYPNAAPDGVHWDVSVAAFLNHMKAQLPTILQTLS